MKQSRKVINGIVILDKPIGMSSNRALQKVKHLFRAKKAGHTGSLDPLATGVLPICFGEATKFSQYLLDSDKTYEVGMQLGVRTNTSDAEGEVVSTRTVPVDLTLEKIDRLFEAFRGDTQQIPSMFSALKHNGKPLYEYAREGITIERKSRPITIFNLNVQSFQVGQVKFIVKCSKGTYVRTLVDDFGEALGCGAHVIALRRIAAGPFNENQMFSLSQLEAMSEENLKAVILPVETAILDWPRVNLTAEEALCLQQGKHVSFEVHDSSGRVRLYDTNDHFLGIGWAESNVIKPTRLMAS